MAIIKQLAAYDTASVMADGLISNKSATGFQLLGEGWHIDVIGSGFTYDSWGEPSAGTLTTVRDYYGATLTQEISGLNITWSTFLSGDYNLWLAGDDTFYGFNGGDDYFYLAGGNDKAYGYGGDDELDGGAGNDTIDGGTGNDWLGGYGGNDSLIGGLGNDDLDGGYGNDTMNGGNWNDDLVGGIGKDSMSGGYGADTFYFDGIRESLRGALHDVITDFSHADGDKIDVTYIDANGAASGKGTFQFKATAGTAFTGVAGELRWYQENHSGTASDRTWIEGDVNGDRVADIQIELTGLKALVAGDFVLV